MSNIPELQRSASFAFAKASCHHGRILPARHHFPKAPMKSESETNDVSSVVVALVDLLDGRPDGYTAARVNIPKLKNTCFGVRNETDARLTKWKGGLVSKSLPGL